MMQLLIVEVLFLMIATLTVVESELSLYGANVCMKTETYEERTTVKTLKPREVTQKKRCWNVMKLFSCKKTVVVWEEHVEYVMVPRTKIVARCCDGYVEVGGTECVPHCIKGCYHGECVAPDVCDCRPGFHGFNCANACLDGYWGKNCANECNCENGECDSVSGCACFPGWIGSRCKSACPVGYYGYSCKGKCDCREGNCNHTTGECITTTETTESATFPSTTTTRILFTTTDAEEISASDTTQSLSTLIETSTEVDHSTKWVLELIEITLEPETNFTNDFTDEINQTTTNATEITDSISTDSAIIKVVEEVEEFKSTNVVLTKPTTEIETNGNEITTMNTVREEVVQSSTIFPLKTVDEPTIEKNKTSWRSLTVAKDRNDVDKNKTDNFIFEGKENSGKETIFKFLHFLPSLSVISAASFLIVIIVARWVIVSHRRRTRMLVVVASEKGNIFPPEDGVKFHAENLFWVNNCTLNPVYMSDVDLDNPKPPILQTFKPLEKEMTSKERIGY